MAAALSRCRLIYSRLQPKSQLLEPSLNLSIFMSHSRSAAPVVRVPLRNQRAFYYVKPKQKKGPSAKGWMVFGAACVGLATGAVVYLGLPDGTDGAENLYMNEPVPMQYIYRARDTVWDFYEMFTEPSSKILLPDPLQEPYYQPPYTLVLEMTDVLVHPEYDRASGWRFRKRPGVDAFLNQLGPPLFEIVIYTHEVGFSASPVLDGLDTSGMIMYRLFRDATKYDNGTHVKDLSSLNRDLSKVLVIDCNEKATGEHRRNSLILKKWEGNPADTTLVDLIPLLQTIATSDVQDVRTVLDFYRQEDDVVEAFKRNQARLREEEAKRSEQQQQQQQQGQWSGMFGRGLFGRSAGKNITPEK